MRVARCDLLGERWEWNHKMHSYFNIGFRRARMKNINFLQNNIPLSERLNLVNSLEKLFQGKSVFQKYFWERLIKNKNFRNGAKNWPNVYIIKWNDFCWNNLANPAYQSFKKCPSISMRNIISTFVFSSQVQ